MYKVIKRISKENYNLIAFQIMENDILVVETNPLSKTNKSNPSWYTYNSIEEFEEDFKEILAENLAYTSYLEL